MLERLEEIIVWVLVTGLGVSIAWYSFSYWTFELTDMEESYARLAGSGAAAASFASLLLLFMLAMGLYHATFGD